MTDRELLELAAKAASLTGYEWDDEWQCLVKWVPDDVFDQVCTAWNPLTDDGDALRLAVDIGMQSIDFVIDEWPDTAAGIIRKETNRAATRRAIVRAAAETQRQKERNESL